MASAVVGASLCLCSCLDFDLCKAFGVVDSSDDWEFSDFFDSSNASDDLVSFKGDFSEASEAIAAVEFKSSSDSTANSLSWGCTGSLDLSCFSR